MDIGQEIIDRVEAKIKSNQLVLPSLPEIMLQIRTVVGNPKASLASIAKIINTDPSVAARIFKVANSVVYRRDRDISNLTQAVTRLGVNLVRTLVDSHAITQMFGAPSGPLKPFYIDLYIHSLQVAAHAYALAKNYTQVDPELALMAGLVHDIGFLPMSRCADSFPELKNQPEQLIQLMNRLHTQVGEMVLRSWRFPEEIIQASRDHENLDRTDSHKADLTDVIIAANIIIHRNTQHPHAKLDWTALPAFRKLGFMRNEDLERLSELQADIEHAMYMLGSDSAAK